MLAAPDVSATSAATRALFVDERQHSGTHALCEAVGGKTSDYCFTACLIAAGVTNFGRGGTAMALTVRRRQERSRSRDAFYLVSSGARL